jgi:hypothetical protein
MRYCLFQDAQQLTSSQVHPAISMALLDAVRWHVHGYDK